MLVLVLFGLIHLANGCSRILYTDANEKRYTGRSMGWFETLDTNIWAFPANVTYQGSTYDSPVLEWTSKYVSVFAAVKYNASMDGVNEMGLGVNVLYLAEADWGYADRDGQKALSVGAVAQYMLDMFATTEELVTEWSKDQIRIRAPVLPNGKPASAHFSVSDATGDSAIIEYLHGKLVIHHGKEYTVFTNSPPFDEQLALIGYWNEVGGHIFLPGTHRAADRFARLNYNLNVLPKFDNPRESVATVFSLIRHIGVPYGIADPVKPNIASTLWRSVIEHDVPRYYFEDVLNPSLIWVDVLKIKAIITNKPMRLLLQDHPIYAGEQSAMFVETEPFVPIDSPDVLSASGSAKMVCNAAKGSSVSQNLECQVAKTPATCIGSCVWMPEVNCAGYTNKKTCPSDTCTWFDKSCKNPDDCSIGNTGKPTTKGVCNKERRTACLWINDACANQDDLTCSQLGEKDCRFVKRVCKWKPDTTSCLTLPM